ncbi:phage tail tip lysozyme [Demetria terragena]|uniref:phage tail tip lysozyme n=1 Tax=Demetria terragena TaxID=63959 RepID=UPI00037A494E|nr:phage tail tip lysozyme [Demetria terragena]
MPRINRRALYAVASAATLSAGIVVTTIPAAQAADRNGVCDTGEFCYYFNSDQKGSVSDFTKSVGNYETKQPDCYEFKGPGNGKGQCIKNNAASAWNRSSKAVFVYFNSNYGGAFQKIEPGQKAQLNSAVYNNNASHSIGGGNQGSNNQKAAFTFFVNAGYTKQQAAGIVGNLMQESGISVNPNAVQSPGLGRGIAQWSVGGRWDKDSKDNVVWYAGQQGQDRWSLNLQLKFVTYELNTFSYYGKSSLKAATTVRAATIAFQDKYEGCGTCHTETRVSYANQVFNQYG